MPSPAPPSLESPFLPLAQAGEDVPFNLVDDAAAHHHDQEATLEALRQALSNPTEPTSQGDATLHNEAALGEDGALQNEDVAAVAAAAVAEELPTLVPASQVQAASINKAVAQLNQLTAANQAIIDALDPVRVLQGLMGSFKLLQEGHKRQVELVRNIVGAIEGRGPPTIDPQFAVSYVPRSEYDSLKARYDVLVSTRAPAPPTRRSRKNAVENDDRLREGSTPFDDDKPAGRKKRSMKLEHVIHKMANRRLGVEYLIQSFECKGTRELPDPSSIPPTAETSVNGVDEFRPDFRGDVTAPTVRPFLDQVVEDVKAAWAESFAADEPDVDEEQMVKSVHTYWTRLSKRFEEQLMRERGEIHKDELTRRRQNQYRRQQSLVARRTVAFDASPLNLCKLRALYRTLLTIDFAAMTNERPDPKREYTEDEWNAYRKQQCGQRAADAHEVVDKFWISPIVRNLLTILDVFAQDQSARMRRKGRPKQPAPTFHLPPELWDRSQLPQIRPKDAEGLPVPGTNGIVLFKFHVDERVQREFPDWASELYDNPPCPDEDKLLPDLGDVMNANAFYHLRPKVKTAVEAQTVTRLSPEEVQEMLTRPDSEAAQLEETGAAVAAAAAAAAAATTGTEDTSFDLSSADFMSGRGLESIVALATSGQLMGNPFGSPSTAPVAGPLTPHAHPLLPLTLDVAATATPPPAGPSAGSSVRARKQAKRMMSEVPGGAATPVPKRRRADAEEVDVVDEFAGDTSFLDSL